MRLQVLISRQMLYCKEVLSQAAELQSAAQQAEMQAV